MRGERGEKFRMRTQAPDREKGAPIESMGTPPHLSPLTSHFTVSFALMPSARCGVQ